MHKPETQRFEREPRKRPKLLQQLPGKVLERGQCAIVLGFIDKNELSHGKMQDKIHNIHSIPCAYVHFFCTLMIWHIVCVYFASLFALNI